MDKKQTTKPPGWGDMLKAALERHGGIQKKPHKAPSRQFRRATQLRGGGRHDRN